jgi:glycosyltransferase involved in cell wall biosynthesis
VFSIVVPTFRRPQALAALLAGIDAQQFPHDSMEVIIVDDSGNDEIEPVLAQFRSRFSLTGLTTQHLGPAPARQAGIDLAKGRYLAFTDDDCIPDPAWLAELQLALEANPGCAIAGAVLNGLPRNACATASQAIFEFFVSWQAKNEVEYVGTGNVGYPAEDFRAIGGLDRNWELWGGEDRDLSRRWRASARRYLIHRPAIIRHYHPLTPRKFWNQHFRYGRGAARFVRSSTLQPSGFYLGLVTYGFRGGDRGFSPLTGSLVLVSQAATVCGFLTEHLSGKKTRQIRPAKK